MALRNILKDGDPALLKKSREVTDFNERLHTLLDDMRETLLEANGLGLAAPQVGVLRRVALIVEIPAVESVEAEPCDELESTDVGANSVLPPDEPELPEPEPNIIELINPELVFEDGEQTGSEGCLSLPGLYGMVTRPQTVKVKAQDRFGEWFELEASDLTARAACHEIDHLNGIIFTALAERMLTSEELDEMNNPKEEPET